MFIDLIERGGGGGEGREGETLISRPVHALTGVEPAP